MFFVFEGIDGSGKSTQARLLEAYLTRECQRRVLLVREPGGTELGEKLRTLLLEPGSEELAAQTELFLFMAARSHLVEQRILPAIEAGEIVISDRFLWSSVVYQGLAGGIAAEDVLRMGTLATRGLEIAQTFLVDLQPKLAHARATDRNRMEGRGLTFQERVREGFLSLAAQAEASVAVIDGRGGVEEVHQRILRSLPDEVRGS